ncbi:MAG: low molecular weight protein-tyrosine-phosphatase [Flavobacteriales bacterium]
MKVTKILMVCLGNICRSPMAEGILRTKILATGKKAIVDSAGTSNYHVGENPDYRAIVTLRNKNIDISGLAGRQFSVSDFDEFDFIYAMDSSNYKNILALARNENDKAKVDLIMNLVEPGSNRSVPDPYFGEHDGFEQVYKMLDAATEKIIEKL